jgi:hypothetical protein
LAFSNYGLESKKKTQTVVKELGSKVTFYLVRVRFEQRTDHVPERDEHELHSPVVAEDNQDEHGHPEPQDVAHRGKVVRKPLAGKLPERFHDIGP